FKKAHEELIISVNYQKQPGKSINFKDSDPEKDYHVIIFSDNGIGFDNEHKEKMFQVFQRLNTKEKYDGTGIGLALVKKIMEQHNGFVDAFGELNKGATFYLYFPVES